MDLGDKGADSFQQALFSWERLCIHESEAEFPNMEVSGRVQQAGNL